MLKFEIISKILPEDKITWNRKVFVTFDIDWAHDEIIDDTLDLLKRANIPATFMTLKSKCIPASTKNTAKIKFSISSMARSISSLFALLITIKPTAIFAKSGETPKSSVIPITSIIVPNTTTDSNARVLTSLAI